MNLPRVGKYGVIILTRCVFVLLLFTIVHIVIKVTQWSGHLSIRGPSSDGILEIRRTSLSSLSELEIGKSVELKRSIDVKSFNPPNSTNGYHSILPSHSVNNNETAGMSDLPLLQEQFIPLSEEDISGVEKFIFFIGYPRSSHSIIGSMMDAHPEIIIAHEYGLFRQWAGKFKKHHNRQFLYNLLYKNSHNNALHGWRSDAKEKKGYNLEMGATWQGAFKKLRIIGDKAGAVTSHQYESSPSQFVNIYHQLQQTVQIPIRVFHVVRNPYDMISTRLLYSVSDRNGAKLSTATEEHKYNNTLQLEYQIRRVMSIAKDVQGIIHDCNLTVLEIHNADFIADPKGELRKVCRFLEIECPEDYLQTCYDKTYKYLSRTRLLVEWPQTLVDEVAKQMGNFTFFHRYSFETD